MIDGVVKGVRWLLAFTRTAAAIFLISSVAINFVNIIGRYFFSVSIPWAEEIMLFLMVGCVFTGCCAVAWEGRQIRMDVVRRHVAAEDARVLQCAVGTGADRDRGGGDHIRLAGHHPARGVRRAQPGGEFSAGHSAGDGADRLHPDGAVGRGAARSCAGGARAGDAGGGALALRRTSGDGLSRLFRACRWSC